MLLTRNSKNEQQALLEYLGRSLRVHSVDKMVNTNMELAKIYRAAGRKIEYQILAAELEECWGILLPAWQDC